nr:hypothetical protein GCM10025732_46190 [Glycomyces mayteni]
MLEDGRVFRGEAFGSVGETFGEAVFSTGMTGYQETLTDPSYYGQVVAQTAPQIGNTGWNDEDDESRRIWVAGYVVRDASRVSSNWRAKRGLEDELASQGVVGICEVDTRALTRHLRDKGAMRVGISSRTTDAEELLAKVRNTPQMAGANHVGAVTASEPYTYQAKGAQKYTVAAIDLGIKRNTPAASPSAASPPPCSPPTPTPTPSSPTPPTPCSSPTAPATPPPPTTRSPSRANSCAAASPSSASASATRSSAAPSAWRPTS